MSTANKPSHLVLLGGGHAHVEVLRQFGRHPVPNLKLTLVSRDAHSPYSGMLPGFVAGHYTHKQVHIDLARLARFAGARFIEADAVGLNRDRRELLLADHKPLDYDRLSINIGSTPQLKVPGAREHAVPVKPIDGFTARWKVLLGRARRETAPLRIAVVGGGAGGVELTLAMQHRLRQERQNHGGDPDSLGFLLLTASAELLPTHAPRVRRFFHRTLLERKVELHCAQRVQRVEAGQLWTESGESFSADEVVWVTQAGGAGWLAEAGLATDKQGFLAVNDCLQSVTDAAIFAAGDIASMVNHPREKAGVFAVRQGAPLFNNLRRSLAGQPLEPFHPQRRWLALISTGDRFAVASRGRFSLRGRWVWRWKDWIDQRFMHRFEV